MTTVSELAAEVDRLQNAQDHASMEMRIANEALFEAEAKYGEASRELLKAIVKLRAGVPTTSAREDNA